MRKELDYEELFALVGRPGDKFDDDWIEKADELIPTEGRLVGRQEWDSGGPGAGAGTVDVYLFRGVFVAMDDADNCGPYESFVHAAADVGLFAETDATTRIWTDLHFKGGKASVGPEVKQTRINPAESTTTAKSAKGRVSKKKGAYAPDPDGEETPEDGISKRSVQVAKQRRKRVLYGH